MTNMHGMGLTQYKILVAILTMHTLSVIACTLHCYCDRQA